MRKTITIRINYDKATVHSEKQLEAGLREEIERAIGRGLLTPLGDEIIDDWKVSIT